MRADCADVNCNALACGAGCACVGGAAQETTCTDGIDNDGDGLVDCADTQNCRAATSCGTGCVCGAGVPTESQCDDGADNDRDGRTDCADSDCNARTCATSRLCCASGTCGC